MGLRCELEHRDAVDQLGIEEAVLQMTKGSGIERVVPVCLLAARVATQDVLSITGTATPSGASLSAAESPASPTNRLRRDDAEAARRCGHLRKAASAGSVFLIRRALPPSTHPLPMPTPLRL